MHITKVLKKAVIALILCLFTSAGAYAAKTKVMVICAYNPDSNNLSYTIDAFSKHMRERQEDFDISVECLWCNKFSDYASWKTRLLKILSKCSSQYQRPDIILVLGQEAVAAYLDINLSDLPDIPVICGMCSRNFIEFPQNSEDIDNWIPENRDITEVAALYNIVGGEFYEYNVDKNIELIGKLFPYVNNITFLSDNSYGGFCQKALVIESATRHNKYTYNWLDGRNLTVLSAADSISQLKGNTALLVGAWRFDKDNRFYINSSMEMLRQSNTHLAVITISNTGLDSWAVGGYTPDYQNLGPLLAERVIEYETTGKTTMDFIDLSYKFNYKAMKDIGITEEELPSGSIVMNKPSSIFQTYSKEIVLVIVIIVGLSIVLCIVVNNLRKIRKLKIELEKKQKELIISKNKAEKSSMLKTTFLADMSHEIRTPLNAIVGFSQVIATQCDSLSKDERNKILDIIYKNSNLLTNLVNSILDISRIESGRAKFDIEEIDLVETCKTMLNTSQMAAGKPNIRFMLDTSIAAFPFNTDRLRLQQVLMNLLNNAVKFTEEGEITVSLDYDKDDGCRIIVSDTGKGIPPDKAEEVFGRFVKLEEYSNGTGLGLSLCRMIVEKLGGRIWVDTSYTGGARFIFTLPQIVGEEQ